MATLDRALLARAVGMDCGKAAGIFKPSSSSLRTRLRLGRERLKAADFANIEVVLNWIKPENRTERKLNQMAEQTLVLVKPDGVQRGLAGEVITRLERRGLKLVGMKLMQVSEELARRHYGEHVDRPFFGGLVSFITSSPIVAMVWEANNAVEIVRNTMGQTNPVSSAAGTIRGDLGIDIGRNLVHGSDSTESAEREVNLFFRPEEIISYQRSVDAWVNE